MRIVFALTFFFVSFFCCAQRVSIKNDFVFSHLTAKEGLSINSINCVFQDSRGFIWIGTTDGLNLYAANNIIVFRNDPKDSLSLPDNTIQGIAEDKKQNLWITSNGGLTRMDLPSHRVEKVYRRTEKPNSIYSSIVLYIDKEDRVWTADLGIDLYDPKCDCFHHYINKYYQEERDFRASNSVTSLLQDSKGRMWSGTLNGVYQFDPSTGIFSKPVKVISAAEEGKKGGSESLITQIFEDHQQQLWLGTWGSGLVKFLPDEKNYNSYNTIDLTTNKLTAYNIVNRIAESETADGKYHLWVTSEMGFAEWSDPQKKFLVHELRSSYGGGFSSLYTDRTGIVWIGTKSEGLFTLDPFSQIFKTTFFNSTQFSKGFGEVNYIFSEGDTVWVTTWYGSAVYKFDKNFNLLKKWEHVPPSDRSDESNRGNHIFRDMQGYLWISNFNGLHRFNSKTGEFKSYRHNPKDSTSLPSNRVVKYFEDSEGVSWVCFYKKGICKFDSRTGKFFDYSNGIKSKNGGTLYFNVWDILEDQSHNLWFADDGLGLWKFDRKEAKLKRAFAKEIPAGHVASLYKDERNVIWVATSNGLGRIEGDSAKLFTASDGLPSNDIFIVQGSQGLVWMLTNQGLARFDGSDKVKVFKQEDGLEKFSSEGTAFQKLNDGRMIIATSGYMTVFNPSLMPVNSNKPPVYLTQFKVFGKPVEWSQEGSKKSITLSYTQNQFSFDFAVLNYSNALGNKFYYKMEGFDRDWTLSKQGFANYTNLDAGDYTFRVKGANADGSINEDGDFVLLKIVPPIWQTSWFMALCAVILVAIVYVIYRIRVNQLLRLEKLRSKISTDLHDDMGSTLSSISILSNMALKANDSAKQDMISEINENSITLMERMDDIVWSINPRNDSFDRLLVRIQNFASKLFEVKGIEYQIEVPESISNIKLSMEDRQHVYLIMKEAVNNLVKYSECKSARIKVSVAPLMVEISDDGKGFDVSKTFQGNGIQSMNSRARLMKAELSIQSSEGRGTSLFLKIK